MTGYRLATIEVQAGARAAIVADGLVYDCALLTGDDAHATTQGVLEDWERAHPLLDAASRAPSHTGTPVDAVKLLAPIPRPVAIYCAGANYRDHAEEMAVLSGKPAEPRTAESRPWFFLKSPRAVAAPGEVLQVSGTAEQIDWEAELVAVIGRRARDVPVDTALDHVAGYTCGNDLSARDYVFRHDEPPGSPFRADWTRHKNFDGACPMGPWIVPAAYVSDAANLPIRLWVNNSLMQDSTSSRMIFSTAELVAHLSEAITLHPGDMIMTGTPAGVGAARGEFLKAGDALRVDIGEIGLLQNTIA
jgi:2-keto-4-pentenoate hydratase/2-oxohepta-3-ene-1,7-dioic acid hydratase in catechol pathway